jgi:hypothetical protein
MAAGSAGFLAANARLLVNTTEINSVAVKRIKRENLIPLIPP